MCLCGVDYFSTLGYQPSIAFEGAGTLAPIATLVLVLVTLLGALPIYCHVAGETPDGVGSVGMIERMFSGWASKIAVLVLVGFAATDFVITKTLSAADAAAHLISNPLYAGTMPGWMQGQMAVAMFLLVLLGGMFLKGYDEVVGVATALVVAYIGLTAFIVGMGVWYLVSHPTLLPHWIGEISAGRYHLEHAPISRTGPWVAIAIACLIFLKLALGMSGFETGVLHIHLVRGTTDDPADVAGRIRHTRMLLVTAALIMSVLLLGSSLVTGTDTLIPAEELRLEPVKGKAMDRALAYIAHGESPHAICPLFGRVFGTIYDVSTILILWFAGASAMAGLLNMVPRYLPRYGMAPEWAAAYRPLVIAFTVINLVVTWCFRADRPGHRTLDEKEAEVRRKHRIPANVPLVFLEVHYGDTSEFHNAPIISAKQEGDRFIIVARDVVSVSHTIAQIAIEMSKSGTPLDIVFGWSLGSALWLATEFLLFGQGDVPNSVFALLQKAVPNPALRPTVLVG